MRKLLLVGCVALLVVSAAAATRMRWHGDLGPYGNAVGMSVRVGSPFSTGMAQLEPSRRIRIESVRLKDPTRGVVLAGALVHPIGQGMVGTERQFPPTFPPVEMRPAAGTVVPAHAGVVLVVGIRATVPGDFRVQGVEVRYRERLHGIDVRRSAHVGHEVVGCAVRTTARIPRCSIPEPFAG